LGIDAFGHQIYQKDPKTGKSVPVGAGTSSAFWHMISNALESTTPASFVVRSIDAARGIQPSEASTLWHQVPSKTASAQLRHGSGFWNVVARTINPVRPTYYTASKATKGRGLTGPSLGSSSLGSSGLSSGFGGTP
jgi:hypothetical protein